MPAEKKPVHSAADILRSMENLVALQSSGILPDVSEGLAEAVKAFDAAPCDTIADALAFISASRRLGQSIILDVARGEIPDGDSIAAADRYMDIAVAFFRGEEMRRKHGHFAGFTLH